MLYKSTAHKPVITLNEKNSSSHNLPGRDESSVHEGRAREQQDCVRAEKTSFGKSNKNKVVTQQKDLGYSRRCNISKASVLVSALVRRSRCTDSPAATSKGRDQREGGESLQGGTEGSGLAEARKDRRRRRRRRKGKLSQEQPGCRSAAEEHSGIKLQQMERKTRKDKVGQRGLERLNLKPVKTWSRTGGECK